MDNTLKSQSLPNVDWTPEYCRSAARAASALAVGTSGRSKKHWERIERIWLDRAAKAEAQA